MTWLADAEERSNAYVARPPSWDSPLVLMVLTPIARRPAPSFPGRKQGKKVDSKPPPVALEKSGSGWKRPMRSGGGGDTCRVVGRAFNGLSTQSSKEDIKRKMSELGRLPANEVAQAFVKRAVTQGQFSSLYASAYQALMQSTHDQPTMEALIKEAVAEIALQYTEDSVTKEGVLGYARFIETIQQRSGRENFVSQTLRALKAKPVTLSYVIIGLEHPKRLCSISPLKDVLKCHHSAPRIASLLQTAYALIWG